MCISSYQLHNTQKINIRFRPSALYSYSFSPFYTSEQLYPSGSEMVKYLQRVATQYKLLDKIQLNTNVTEVRWIESDHEWQITLSCLVEGMGDLSEADRKQRIATHGREAIYLSEVKVRAKVIVSCVGILVEPNAWPTNIPGREAFRGTIFHCSRWRNEVDFHNKDVIVLGSGCSAAQVVPSLFKAPFDVKSVTQIMRSPPWVMPRLEEPFGRDKYARYAPKIMGYFPVLGYVFRIGLFLLVEVIWKTVFQQENVKWRGAVERSTLERTHALIPKKYHGIMTPRYGYGCKRRVFDSEWLKSMNNPNFLLTTRPLQGLQPDGVVLGPSPNSLNEEAESTMSTKDAQLHADIIVLANGYEATQWFHPLKVYGRGGKLIHDVWDERGGAQAYMSTAMDGFPNFFIAGGPNSANGHSSFILGSENITEYIIKIVGPVLRGDAIYVEPKKESEIQWTNNIQRDLKGTVFPGCTSWYQDENGWNSTMYP